MLIQFKEELLRRYPTIYFMLTEELPWADSAALLKDIYRGQA